VNKLTHVSHTLLANSNNQGILSKTWSSDLLSERQDAKYFAEYSWWCCACV